ncbi:MAG: hydrogenase formation protein HypD [Deltaproteobacteria bacterium]|jgi:hydrogenase expression/formation protein HypD|nr:hydrogenase formation protein HypD [Deltaproteobacteria bacterium]
MDYANAFRDPALCRPLVERLRASLTRPLRFMEVCGTHTAAIFQSGLRSLLPKEITHLSGPGCPVCVTHDSEIAAFLNLAGRDGVIIASFGDLLRVPGPGRRSLKHAQAEGARVEVVYSSLDALALARNRPDDTVVFLGIGFETTAPTVAAALQMARREGLQNFTVLCLHKLVPPALRQLLSGADCAVDAFLLPGHVSTILGIAPYRFLAEEFHTPGIIAGFDPADILLALCLMAEQHAAGRYATVNAYRRAVADDGNPKARAILKEVFRPGDALWRGLGRIPQSGLVLAPDYEDMDAFARFGLSLREVDPTPGCRCGEVLSGRMHPPGCPLFGRDCTPARPVGPCMVSTEGSCAAYYKYTK